MLDLLFSFKGSYEQKLGLYDQDLFNNTTNYYSILPIYVGLGGTWTSRITSCLDAAKAYSNSLKVEYIDTNWSTIGHHISVICTLIWRNVTSHYDCVFVVSSWLRLRKLERNLGGCPLLSFDHSIRFQTCPSSTNEMTSLGRFFSYHHHHCFVI